MRNQVPPAIIEKIAKELGKPTHSLRIAMQRRACPFGFGFQGNGEKYDYVVSSSKYREFFPDTELVDENGRWIE